MHTGYGHTLALLPKGFVALDQIGRKLGTEALTPGFELTGVDDQRLAFGYQLRLSLLPGCLLAFETGTGLGRLSFGLLDLQNGFQGLLLQTFELTFEHFHVLHQGHLLARILDASAVELLLLGPDAHLLVGHSRLTTATFALPVFQPCRGFGQMRLGLTKGFRFTQGLLDGGITTAIGIQLAIQGL